MSTLESATGPHRPPIVSALVNNCRDTYSVSLPRLSLTGTGPRKDPAPTLTRLLPAC
jgi:hypothetical protein